MIFLSRPGFVFLLFVAQGFSACAQPINDHLTLQRLPVRNKQAAKAMTEKRQRFSNEICKANSSSISDYRDRQIGIKSGRRIIQMAMIT